MSLKKLFIESIEPEIMGLLTTRSGNKFIFRPDITGDFNWIGWEIDSDLTRGQTHKWNDLPKGHIEWFDVDDPPETVSYQPILESTIPSTEKLITYIDHAGSFEDKDKAEQYITYLINTPYPDGWKNIPSKPTVYRIVHLSDQENLDKQDLGKHWTFDKYIFDDPDIIDNIFYDFYGRGLKFDSNNLYLIEAEVPVENIDWEWTVEQNIIHPDEHEIQIQNTKNIKIKNIKKL